MSVINPDDDWNDIREPNDPLPEDRDFWDELDFWDEPESVVVEDETQGLDDGALARLGINAPVYDEPIISMDDLRSGIDFVEELTEELTEELDRNIHEITEVGQIQNRLTELAQNPNLEVSGDLLVDGDLHVNNNVYAPNIRVETNMVTHSNEQLYDVIEDLRSMIYELQGKVSTVENELIEEQEKVRSLEEILERVDY